MEKHLKEILEEMCRRVNVSFDIVNSEPEWYDRCEWTEEEEESFKKWMLNYLQKNKQAKIELGLQYLKKANLKREINNFISFHGWRKK